MCGIAGYVDTAGIGGDAGRRVSAALTRLSPRGPDGDGVWFDPFCALGHRRLAIIDLSAAGAQPMRGFGRVITFNGEIFNFLPLRNELAARGHHFSSRSDTEVLLAGWREWGPDLLPRLNGMFAFAIWDPEHRELVIVRDRYGEKPLFFWHSEAQLAFASDFAALERVADRRFPLDPVALRWLFALRYIPEPWTIGAGARKLPPGHFLRFRGNRLDVTRWHAPPAQNAPRTTSLADATASIRSAMDIAVSERLVADVPVGAFLSGGIDSAIVAATMAQHSTHVRTFTIGFAGGPRYYEERPEARSVAKYLGTDHTEIVVDSKDTLGVLEAAFRGLDEPFGDSSAIASFIISREARRHVKVALSGDGADEVFAGYRKYQGELYAGLYALLPAGLRRAIVQKIAARLPESKKTPLLELLRRLKRFLAFAGEGPSRRHAGWLRQLPEEELTRFLGLSGAEASPEGLVAEVQAESSAADTINQLLATDVSIVLPGDMLVKVDRMSMANGLEIRCPFLDHRVVASAFDLPGAMKLRPGAGKWILRHAFKEQLPESVFRRGKKGFEIPVAEWLTGPLLDRVRASIDPVRLRRQQLFDPDLPSQWLNQLRSGRRDTSWTLWTLIAFQSWAEVHQRPEALA